MLRLKDLSLSAVYLAADPDLLWLLLPPETRALDSHSSVHFPDYSLTLDLPNSRFLILPVKPFVIEVRSLHPSFQKLPSVKLMLALDSHSSLQFSEHSLILNFPSSIAAFPLV